MNTHKALVLATIFSLLSQVNVFGQTDGVLIDYQAAPPARDASAVLELRSTNQGFLAPKVDIANLATAAPVTSAAEGLVVYNTNATTGKGYYFWDGARWLRLLSGNSTPPTGNGTLNYLSKWTPNGTTLGNSQLFDNGTHVGIGTTSPTVSPSSIGTGNLVFQIGNNTGVPELRLAGNNSLDVSSKISFDNSNTGDGMSITFSSNNGTYGPDGLFFVDENNGRLNMKINRDDGMVGIGTADPAATLDIRNSLTAANSLVAILANSAASDLNFELVTRKGANPQVSGDVATQIGLRYQTGDVANSMIRFHRGSGTSGGFMSFTTNDDTERLRIDTDGSLQIGQRAGNNADSRAILMERTATAGGEASGRILFTEHNSTSASAENYGFSIQYSGNALGTVYPSGAKTLVGNGQWAFVGHDNSLDGTLIMSGPRAGGLININGSIDLANGTAINEFSTDGTLGGNSNNAAPTEQAVKTYVDAQVTAADDWTQTGSVLYPNSTAWDVGVGLSAPLNDLHVHSTVTNELTTSLRLSGTGTVVGGGNAIFFKTSTNTDLDRYGVKMGAIRSDANNGAAEFVIQLEKTPIASGVVDVLRIDDTGQVGIGTTNPQAGLHIETPGNPTLIVRNATTTGGAAINFSDVTGYAQTGTLEYRHSDTQSFSYGNSFHLSGTESSMIFRVEGDGSYAGNVGIGTTSPARNLVVESDGDAAIWIDGDKNNSGESDNAYLKISQDGNLVEGILGLVGANNVDPEGNAYTGMVNNGLLLGTTTAAALQFGTDDNVRMSVGTTGDVSVTNLSGTGNRPVYADAGGTLITSSANSTFAMSATMAYSEDDMWGDGGSGTGTLSGDDNRTTQTMPFSITIDGNSYNQVTIGTNGWISFGDPGTNAVGNSSLPTSTFSAPTIFPYWDDLRTEGDAVRYGYVGSSPNRTYIVDYVAETYSGSYNVRFQVQIHETSGLINVTYRDEMHNDANGQNATIGFQSSGGSSATAYPITYNGKVLDDNRDTNQGWSVSPIR